VIISKYLGFYNLNNKGLERVSVVFEEKYPIEFVIEMYLLYYGYYNKITITDIFKKKYSRFIKIKNKYKKRKNITYNGRIEKVLKGYDLFLTEEVIGYIYKSFIEFYIIDSTKGGWWTETSYLYDENENSIELIVNYYTEYNIWSFKNYFILLSEYSFSLKNQKLDKGLIFSFFLDKKVAPKFIRDKGIVDLEESDE